MYRMHNPSMKSANVLHRLSLQKLSLLNKCALSPWLQESQTAQNGKLGSADDTADKGVGCTQSSAGGGKPSAVPNPGFAAPPEGPGSSAVSHSGFATPPEAPGSSTGLFSALHTQNTDVFEDALIEFVSEVCFYFPPLDLKAVGWYEHQLHGCQANDAPSLHLGFQKP